MILLQLFLAFSKIGLFAIGGAYSFLPLIEKEVVQNYHWLTKEEFLEVLGLVKIFPGAISIKYATYTGYKVAGVLGAVVANIGNFLAPVVLVSLASMAYLKYKNLPSLQKAYEAIQLAVFAMIIAVAFQSISIGKLYSLRNSLIVIVSFLIFLFTKIDPAIVIICAGILGIFLK